MTSHVTEVTDFISTHSHYAYAATFLLAFSEAIPIIGTLVPGSTLIIAISALVTRAGLNPWLLVAAAAIGAIAGDGLSFWLGQLVDREILERRPLNLFPHLISRSEAFFKRHGGASIFLARFTAVVRAFVPLIAGILRMPARQFYIANVLSAIVWAPVHVFPGIVLGIVIALADPKIERVLVMIVTASIAGWIVFRLVRFCFEHHVLRWPGSPT